MVPQDKACNRKARRKTKQGICGHPWVRSQQFEYHSLVVVFFSVWVCWASTIQCRNIEYHVARCAVCGRALSACVIVCVDSANSWCMCHRCGGCCRRQGTEINGIDDSLATRPATLRDYRSASNLKAARGVLQRATTAGLKARESKRSPPPRVCLVAARASGPDLVNDHPDLRCAGSCNAP